MCSGISDQQLWPGWPPSELRWLRTRFEPSDWPAFKKPESSKYVTKNISTSYEIEIEWFNYCNQFPVPWPKFLYLFTALDGSWSTWSPWSSCNQDCVRHRRRNCNNPEPLSGGTFCKGLDHDVSTCSGDLCRGKYKIEIEFRENIYITKVCFFKSLL